MRSKRREQGKGARGRSRCRSTRRTTVERTKDNTKQRINAAQLEIKSVVKRPRILRNASAA